MRLINADELERKSFCTAPATMINPYGGDRVVLLEDIRKAPTIEAELVVRCKDCKHRIDDEDFVRGHYCMKRPSNGGYFCEDNDFCSYGERKEVNNYAESLS